MLAKKKADVDEAKQRIESGEKWSTVAKDLSDDPASKEQGGKLLGVTKGQQDPKLDAAVFVAVEKKVAGPIKTDAGYYIFRVTKTTEATKQSLRQSEQGIRQLLISQKQQKELDSFSTNFRNEWRARTDCAEEYRVADCRNGRPPTETAAPATPPGQQRPTPGSTGANPPALDGTGTNLVGGNGEGVVIGEQEDPAAAAGGGAFGAPPGAGAMQQAPLALGGAPRQGAGALPPGVATSRRRTRRSRRPAARHPAAGASSRPRRPPAAAEPPRGAGAGAAARGAARARRPHPPAAPRVSVGRTAGRAQHRPAHRRGGIRAGRRRAFRR